ncbi:TadE/TadG family type IV pilus assembly protein [Sphingomonas sp. J315]|uniref:TadE/TadG family type IV pilus assembly protein n=1 Tax=Sphingomonas sp. J315 TaxID=2898433 RepID=UPI0021AE059F|nr:TadE/TadG family type IV pilus assembly protein [Sphingomonas sp. J315]UUX99566.1 pilus assembly protein TadG-related protein [Sphingomonas sp. J315]
MPLRPTTVTSARATMAALARDKRGNTLAIVAASLIPLAGMVGGGVDLSRMYIVKTRLQHACDAGALAGRKQMGGGTWAFNNYAARGAAERFFDANIQETPYGASSVTKSYTESAGKVTGVASATLPMTLMRVLGKTTETLSVTCDAEMRLPNTDVMFVLDTTGSMASKAVNTDSQTKMEALKSAVKCFYETVARLDTTENCVGGAPSGGTSNTVQIRFGFMPYATNVNVGKLLPTAYIADSWPYQSREPQFTTTTQTIWSDGATTQTGTGWDRDDSGSWNNAPSSTNTTASSTSDCQSKVPGNELTSSWGVSRVDSTKVRQAATRALSPGTPARTRNGTSIAIGTIARRTDGAGSSGAPQTDISCAITACHRRALKRLSRRSTAGAMRRSRTISAA